MPTRITKTLVHWLLRRSMRERRFDASMKHPRFAEFANRVRSGRQSEFGTAFAELPTDERHVILSGLADQSTVDQFEGWTEDPAGLLLHGTALITHAWRARTALAAKYVTADGARQFVELLNRSVDTLVAAHLAQPEDPEPLARLLRVLMGLESPHSEIYECYERLAATRQHHLAAGYQAVEALGAKWGGSDQAALAFAYTQANAEPRNRSLIAYAHIENWVFASQAPEQGDRYFARPHVREDVLHAYEGDALRTGVDYFALMARNVYAMCFYMLKDKVRAREELAIVADRFPSKPWVYLAAVESTAVDTARAWSGLPKNPG